MRVFAGEKLFKADSSTKSKDQSVHMRSLISTFGFRYIESIVTLFSVSNSQAANKYADFDKTRSETPVCFSCDGTHIW